MKLSVLALDYDGTTARHDTMGPLVRDARLFSLEDAIYKLAAFPAEGMATLRMPSSTSMEIAQERPRALKEPVGFRPSSLIHRSSAPTAAPMRFARMRGVIPSPM